VYAAVVTATKAVRKGPKARQERNIPLPLAVFIPPPTCKTFIWKGRKQKQSPKRVGRPKVDERPEI